MPPPNDNSTPSFDGQAAVPGFTLFKGKDGNNFYLKGEGLSDDEVQSRVASIRRQTTAQQAPVSAQAKQPGAMQTKKGGAISTPQSRAVDEFIKNPKAVDTYGQNVDDSSMLSFMQPRQGDPAAVRTLKGVTRAATSPATAPISLLAPPSPEEMPFAVGAGANGAAALAVKRGLVDPAVSAGKKSVAAFKQAMDPTLDTSTRIIKGGEGLLHGVNALLPVLGPMSEGAFSSAMSGDTAGAIGEGATNVAMMKAGGEAAEDTGTRVQTKAGKVASKPAPSGAKFQEALNNTNKEVLQHASDEGIDLTPEQASGDITGKQGMAEQAKIGGKQLRESIQANKDKLGQAINDFADRQDPQRLGLSEESAGNSIKQAVQTGKDVAHDNAMNGYQQMQGLDKVPIDTSAISAKWQEVRGRLPMGVENQIIAQTPRDMVASMRDILAGRKANITAQQAIAMRSFMRQLGDVGENLPGVVQGAFKQMTAAADGALDTGLGKAGMKDQWRSANAGWKDYASKYGGDRQSPLYKILNQGDPAKITRSLMNNASANDIKMLQGEGLTAAIEPLKRMVINDIARNKFGVGRDGLGGYSNSFLNTLFGPAAVKELYLKGELARRLDFDVNPSRTAKVTTAADQAINPLKPLTSAGNVAKYAVAAKKNMPKPASSYLGSPSRLAIAPPLIAAGTLPALQTSGNRTAGLLSAPQ